MVRTVLAAIVFASTISTASAADPKPPATKLIELKLSPVTDGKKADWPICTASTTFVVGNKQDIWIGGRRKQFGIAVKSGPTPDLLVVEIVETDGPDAEIPRRTYAPRLIVVADGQTTSSRGELHEIEIKVADAK